MRHSSPARARGFTLVELLVVIAIIGTLVALLLPAVQNARESARNNTCKNSMRQLAVALTNYDSTQGTLPGYINDIEDVRSPKTGRLNQFRDVRQGSWVVLLFPYLEQNALWDNWSSFGSATTAVGNTPELEILECPSDAPEIPGAPWLSYVGNSGQMMEGGNIAQNAANGVFVDRSVNLNAIPSQAEDGREEAPVPQISIDYISSNDGTSNTVMVSESLYPRYYTYTNGDPQEVPVFDSRNKAPVFADNPIWFGFVWSNTNNQAYKINGIPDDADAASIQYMHQLQNVHAFPSSNHPGGVNMAFADARVVYVNETIDPVIYGQLMTSNARRSNYAPNGVPDRKLPPVSDDAF